MGVEVFSPERLTNSSHGFWKHDRLTNRKQARKRVLQLHQITEILDSAVNGEAEACDPEPLSETRSQIIPPPNSSQNVLNHHNGVTTAQPGAGQPGIRWR
jgi:hypothetical protein